MIQCHLLECPLWYIFKSVNKQAARIIHTTAKNTAMVVDEIAQSKISVVSVVIIISELKLFVT
jgi:hypothetical protein